MKKVIVLLTVFSLAIWTVGAVFLPLHEANAATIYVDADKCPGPGTGTQGDPYCSITLGVTNANDNDTIEVAEGDYSPSTTNEVLPIDVTNDGIRIE